MAGLIGLADAKFSDFVRLRQLLPSAYLSIDRSLLPGLSLLTSIFISIDLIGCPRSLWSPPFVVRIPGHQHISQARGSSTLTSIYERVSLKMFVSRSLTSAKTAWLPVRLPHLLPVRSSRPDGVARCFAYC
jgi:hypothetical protein